MKKILFVIVCIAALSCKKESTDSRYKQFYGKWELAGRASFWSGQSFPPGNGNIMVLGKNGVYERISADTVRFRGQYSLDEKKECLGEAKKIHLSTTDPTLSVYREPTLTLYEDNNYLVIDPPNCTADMNSYGYRRIK